METYYWPGADFNQRRHVIVTSSLVFSALFGEPARYATLDGALSPD